MFNDEVMDLGVKTKELEILKRYLLRKLKGYGGITYHELDDLCHMMGWIEEEEKEGE